MGLHRAYAALDLVNRFERLDSACVADAQQGAHVMHPRIKSLSPGHTIAGPAFTVRAYLGSMMTVQKALIEAEPGDVIVIHGYPRAPTVRPLVVAPRSITPSVASRGSSIHRRPTK